MLLKVLRWYPLILSVRTVLTVNFPQHAARCSAEASKWSVISQQTARMQKSCHSASWKQELSRPLSMWVKSQCIKAVWTGQDRTKKQTLTGVQSGPGTGEEGVTIITGVFGHRPAWHSRPLSFTSSSGLRKPPTSSAINLGPFQVQIKPRLLRFTEATAMITLAGDFARLKRSDGNNYLLHLASLKLTIRTEAAPLKRMMGHQEMPS